MRPLAGTGPMRLVNTLKHNLRAQLDNVWVVVDAGANAGTAGEVVVRHKLKVQAPIPIHADGQIVLLAAQHRAVIGVEF